MRILICCGENPDAVISTEESLIYAFKDIGHEVITCGAMYGENSQDKKSTRDIVVNDKPHPETYTYQEILNKLDKPPDLIIQTDSHFYFTGTKPVNIPSVYWITDPHRGASVFRKMAVEGKFDYVFITQKYFIPLFERVGLNCKWLPYAFDERYCHIHKTIKPESDIVFIGETGLNKNLLDFPLYDAEIDAAYHEGSYPYVRPEDRYANWDNHTMEYAERAEILLRLSQDYNLRVYDKSKGIKYGQIISRGKIVVNHSVWKDSALRLFEVLACNRLLIADMLPYQNELLLDRIHYRTYNHYFLPFIANFDLEYENIQQIIDYYLTNEDKSQQISYEGYKHVNRYHTFRHRAQEIIDCVFNDRIQPPHAQGKDAE